MKTSRLREAKLPIRHALVVALVAGFAFVGLSGVAVANPPIAEPFIFVFDDINPCGGPDHTVTISGTSWVHVHNGRIVFHSERTITTSTGFEGHGTDSYVLNGETEKFTLNDILTDESGDRIRAHFVFVFDISTLTVRVEGGFLTCLGP